MSSQINTKINSALESIGVLWCPVMYRFETDRPNGIVIDGFTDTDIFPCCLQAVEDVSRETESGQKERVITFYLFDQIEAVNNDIVGEIIPLYDRLEELVFAFRNALQNTTDYCEIEGDMTRSHHGLAIVEAGINFQLKIRESCWQ